MDELRFDGKSIIITGAGRGFGRCHAHLLASRGARLVIADWGMELNGLGSSPDPIEQVAKEIEAEGGEAIALHIDVADEENAKTVVQTALDAYGKLDVLVNNAGIADPDWFDDQTAERIERMTRNQYYSVVWMSKAAWPHLKASGGNIVNTASEALLGNVPKAASYCGAKGGVFAFSRALALDGQQFGVRVNAICPRGNTRLSAPEVLAFHFDAPIENFINNPFLDGMKPEYVSPAVAFFAHESCELTGETFICGGLKVMRLACFETQGITLEGNITPEDIVANLDAVMELKDATYMPIAMFND
jgi:NAD(P)-dependent dehydrogenase (short-subunit alcohol dehydrogenase family)